MHPSVEILILDAGKNTVSCCPRKGRAGAGNPRAWMKVYFAAVLHGQTRALARARRGGGRGRSARAAGAERERVACGHCQRGRAAERTERAERERGRAQRAGRAEPAERAERAQRAQREPRRGGARAEPAALAR